MKTTNDLVSSKKEASIATLWWVYVLLMLMLGATVAVAYVPMMHGIGNIIMAAIIAVTKAGMVVWFFMHLRETHRLVIALFGSSLFMLAVGAILSLADYLTR